MAARRITRRRVVLQTAALAAGGLAAFPLLRRSAAAGALPATRVAMIERGEADIIYDVPGEMIAQVKSNPKLLLAPVVSGNFWLEFLGLLDPKSPSMTSGCRRRSASRSTATRSTKPSAAASGLSTATGSITTSNTAWNGRKWPHDLGKAKKLMAEAGFPNGFAINWLTPAPPYYSRGERILSQLQAIGIRGKLQTLERATYTKRREAGLKAWPGVNIILAGARIGASWANWYETAF